MASMNQRVFATATLRGQLVGLAVELRLAMNFHAVELRTVVQLAIPKVREMPDG
jgi:hypothetical protein